MKKFVALASAFALLLTLAACSTSSLSENSVTTSQVQQVDEITLTPDLAAEGYEYWQGGSDLIYRWATEKEKAGITCYSTWCSAINVKAISTCRSVSYEYDEIDGQGQVISHRSNGLSMVADPEGEVIPGWGYVLSDMSQAKQFKLTSMKCSTSGYDSSKRNDGNSDAFASDQTAESDNNFQGQQPAQPKGHYENRCTKVWVANHDPNQNGTTSIGSWVDQCQQVWVNW